MTPFEWEPEKFRQSTQIIFHQLLTCVNSFVWCVHVVFSLFFKWGHTIESIILWMIDSRSQCYLDSTEFSNMDYITNIRSNMRICKFFYIILSPIAIYSWWRHQMEIFSALLAICAGNSPVTGEFPTQRPVTRSFDVYFDLRPNERLSKQSWGWWFETLSRSLWRHRNVYAINDSECMLRRALHLIISLCTGIKSVSLRIEPL